MIPRNFRRTLFYNSRNGAVVIALAVNKAKIIDCVVYLHRLAETAYFLFTQEQYEKMPGANYLAILRIKATELPLKLPANIATCTLWADNCITDNCISKSAGFTRCANTIMYSGFWHMSVDQNPI